MTPNPHAYPYQLPPVPPTGGNSAFERGALILAWLLSPEGEGSYGYVSDDDLRRADASGIVAVAPRGCHPVALARVSEVRTRIARTLAARAREASQPAGVPPPGAPDVRGTSRVPVASGPSTRPPGGATATPAASWEF
jgi:hypothetical protein